MSVIVKGGVGENVTPEVTAQTPVITQIAENLGVTITTPSGTNKQILQGNNTNLLNIKNNAKKEGLYVWKKLTADGGTFVDYVVDNNESKYPDGGTQGDYWYEKVVEGVTGIDFGEVTLTSDSSSVTFNHNLGVTPSFAAFVPKVKPTIGSSEEITVLNVNGLALYRRGSLNHTTGSYTYSYYYGSGDVTLTETTVNLKSASSYKFKSTTYYWIAIV